MLFPATGAHYANFDIWMVNLIARYWLAGLVTVFCAFVMYDTLSLRSTSGERTQCKLNTRKAWSSTGNGKVAYTGSPVHQESCESLTLFPGLFSLKLGVLSEYSNSDHFANKLRFRTDLRSQEWLACTFFGRNTLLRLVIRMQTII